MNNNNQQFSVRSFPHAIVHIDGDAFFASVEQARDWRLRGKPVVTGLERNIAASMSYEAKRAGVTRGMLISDVKKVCPDAYVVRSHYELYSLYARRMYSIVRRYTPVVEEYSIDECFADITGMRSYYKKSYEEIVSDIKLSLETELGITFGVGLGPNKSIAKLASKRNKPAGLTVIPAKKIHQYLVDTPIEKIWGIGMNTAELLKKFGVFSALDFATKDFFWITSHKLAKPYVEIWHELRGAFVKQLNTVLRDDIGSITTSQTFTPASSDVSFVFAELSKNIEKACEKLRMHSMRSNSVEIFLKTNRFQYVSRNIVLPIYTADPRYVLSYVSSVIHELFNKGCGTYYGVTQYNGPQYYIAYGVKHYVRNNVGKDDVKQYSSSSTGGVFRTTGVVFRNLLPESHTQESLFDRYNVVESTVPESAWNKACYTKSCNTQPSDLFKTDTINQKHTSLSDIFGVVDQLNGRFGRNSIYLASSMLSNEYREKEKKLNDARAGIVYDACDIYAPTKRYFELPFLGVVK